MGKLPGSYGLLGLMLLLTACIVDLYERNFVVVVIGSVGLLLFLRASGAWLRPRLGRLLGPMTPFKASLTAWAFFLISAFFLWQNWQDLQAGKTVLPKRHGPRVIVTSESNPLSFYTKLGITSLVFGLTMVGTSYCLYRLTWPAKDKKGG